MLMPPCSSNYFCPAIRGVSRILRHPAYQTPGATVEKAERGCPNPVVRSLWMSLRVIVK